MSPPSLPSPASVALSLPARLRQLAPHYLRSRPHSTDDAEAREDAAYEQRKLVAALKVTIGTFAFGIIIISLHWSAGL